MKTQNFKVIILMFFFVLMPLANRAQCSNPTPTCPLTFGNGLICSQTVDITWDWYDGCSPAPTNICGGGSATGIAAGSTVPLSCATLCPPVLCDLRVTVTAINGCAITPVSLRWSSSCAASNGTGIGSASLPCVCTPTSPPDAPCCDGGVSLLMFTNDWVISVN